MLQGVFRLQFHSNHLIPWDKLFAKKCHSIFKQNKKNLFLCSLLFILSPISLHDSKAESCLKVFMIMNIPKALGQTPNYSTNF